ncbi:hypothetical protein B0H13DRAFT_1890236 [Mycena leptocephala]|nr:hypothetical protein B0H13DRAFT_1890236 [Mycena leptocephala]
MRREGTVKTPAPALVGVWRVPPPRRPLRARIHVPGQHIARARTRRGERERMLYTTHSRAPSSISTSLSPRSLDDERERECDEGGVTCAQRTYTSAPRPRYTPSGLNVPHICMCGGAASWIKRLCLRSPMTGTRGRGRGRRRGQRVAAEATLWPITGTASTSAHTAAARGLEARPSRYARRSLTLADDGTAMGKGEGVAGRGRGEGASGGEEGGDEEGGDEDDDSEGESREGYGRLSSTSVDILRRDGREYPLSISSRDARVSTSVDGARAFHPLLHPAPAPAPSPLGARVRIKIPIPIPISIVIPVAHLHLHSHLHLQLRALHCHPHQVDIRERRRRGEGGGVAVSLIEVDEGRGEGGVSARAPPRRAALLHWRERLQFADAAGAAPGRKGGGRCGPVTWHSHRERRNEDQEQEGGSARATEHLRPAAQRERRLLVCVRTPDEREALANGERVPIRVVPRKPRPQRSAMSARNPRGFSAQDRYPVLHGEIWYSPRRNGGDRGRDAEDGPRHFGLVRSGQEKTRGKLTDIKLQVTSRTLLSFAVTSPSRANQAEDPDREETRPRVPRPERMWRQGQRTPSYDVAVVARWPEH